jgi:hypothetical protein
MGKPSRRRAAPPAPPPSAPATRRPLLVPMLLVGLVLAALADDRHAGEVADGRQMIRTAIAIVESGMLGQARDTDFTLPRRGGDAVSRFGMGMSLLQLPAAWLAPRIEAWRGPTSSQFLFLLAPFACVLLASWAAGRIVLLLGGSRRAAGWAVVGAALGSPLGSYAAMEFSEPAQAAALTGALALALAATAADSRRAADRLASAAGALAGFAVLVKSSLLVVAPWVLLPLLAAPAPPRRRRSLALAVAGAAPLLALWAAFEWLRFSRLLGGYPDERFSHPFLDGLWRLLVGPNRGLVIYLPLTVLAVAWAARALRRREPVRAATAAAVLAVTASLLAISAAFWCWHGMEGWGPRFLVPAMPSLVALAALWLARRRPALGWALLGLSCLINLPPLLQHPTPVATYVMNCRWPAIAPERVADYPFYALGESENGALTVVPFAVLEEEPSASALLVYPWFLAATFRSDETLARRLAAPPWVAARPTIVPPAALLTGEAVRALAPRPRVGFLGRSLLGGGAAAGYASVYADGLLDQVVRAQQLGEAEHALALAQAVARIAPSADADVAMLESLRLNGRRDEAGTYLRAMPMEHRRDPRVNVVLALFERDAGNEQGARVFLSSVADAFAGLPAQAALAKPLAQWPAGLHDMTVAPRRDASVDAPRGR